MNDIDLKIYICAICNYLSEKNVILTLILVNILAALCDRLLDFDENVRKQVVAVICDVACHALNAIPLETVKLVAERLRDKSVHMLFLPSVFAYLFL